MHATVQNKTNSGRHGTEEIEYLQALFVHRRAEEAFKKGAVKKMSQFLEVEGGGMWICSVFKLEHCNMYPESGAGS